MWLLSCGMHRAGSTLQYQIATKVAEFHPQTHLVGWVSPSETEWVFGNATDDPDALYIAKLHDYDPAVEAFWEKFHPKAIYIYRDVRDVVVSTMHMENWAFDSVEMLARLDSVVRNYYAWTRKPGTLISRYEDVMAEGGLLAEVEKIAQYMNIELTAEQIQQIASAVTIKANQQRIEQFDYENKGVQYPNTLFDPQSLFHHNHIRSGASEQWRSELTPEQIAMVDVWVGEWLQERGYAVAQYSEQEKIETLRKLCESVLFRAAKQIDVISGLQAYVKEMEPSRSGSQTPAAQARRPLPKPGTNLQQLQQQVEMLTAHIEGARNRKIARLMSRLGKPLI